MDFDIVYNIFFIITISILFLIKKIKFLIKKFILINFFLASFIIWVSKINNYYFNYTSINNFFKFENFNFINILILLSIEILYYFWSYISYSSYLSDWNIPLPQRRDLRPIFNIVFFYLMIILYYSLIRN